MKGRIGSSGYNYQEWRGPFYPQKMPQRMWLEHYSSTFDKVEINNPARQYQSGSCYRAVIPCA